MSSADIQEYLDEHKQEVPEGIYLALSNLCLEKNEQEEKNDEKKLDYYTVSYFEIGIQQCGESHLHMESDPKTRVIALSTQKKQNFDRCLKSHIPITDPVLSEERKCPFSFLRFCECEDEPALHVSHFTYHPYVILTSVKKLRRD